MKPKVKPGDSVVGHSGHEHFDAAMEGTATEEAADLVERQKMGPGRFNAEEAAEKKAAKKR